MRQEIDVVDEADDGVAGVLGQAAQEIADDVLNRLLEPGAYVTKPAQGPEDTAAFPAAAIRRLCERQRGARERHDDGRGNQDEHRRNKARRSHR